MLTKKPPNRPLIQIGGCPNALISLMKYGVKYIICTQKKGPMTLTWISIRLKEFSNQLLKLSAKFIQRGAHRHRQMVQP